MDYVAPDQVLRDATALSQKKTGLPVGKMVVRGFASGAFLGFATALAFKASAGLPDNVATLVGFAVFPVGFAILTIFSLELATGSFGLFPIGLAQKKITWSASLKNLGIVYLANFLGSVVFGLLFAVAITELFTQGSGAVGEKIISVAQSKTLAYEHAGVAGWVTALTKGILCNWMVATGSIIALSSKSVGGKIAAIWLPIGTFFALGLEHCIVNMFIIPTGMMLGDGISVGEWLIWNQVPVTIGNIIGGGFFAGILYYWAYRE
ncbi:MAG: formate/nitrite transporter family protein [Candidatus Nanopelagicales bacterium]|nr:formate/nitrite transporter family protein [Candidatus Nanopelagicales bacterium]